jgi:DNA-binding HxlR family transcriptional regulator
MLETGTITRKSRADVISQKYLTSTDTATRYFEVPCSVGETMKKIAPSYVERDKCPLCTAIQVIEGRWKPMIFQRLCAGALGFGELRRSMTGVTTKVLRQQLRQLEADGLISRSAPAKPGLRVPFELTPHGKTLGPVFECLWSWGVMHLSHMSDSDVSRDSRLKGS